MTDTLRRQIRNWSHGVQNEIGFWNEWFATKGLSWPEDYSARFDPMMPLEPMLAHLASQLDRTTIRILDVGSGPATNVGRTANGLQIQLRACDPLAPQYATMWETHGAYPPIRTEFAVAEDLSTFFDQSSFDMIHCRNALDHSFDPIRGIVEMLKVVRVGGWIVLRHHPNEAERESYEGFHQYNFACKDGQFLVWNKAESLEPAKLMPIATEFGCTDADGDVVVTIRKKGEFPRPEVMGESRGRLKHLYDAMIDLFSTPPVPAQQG